MCTVTYLPLPRGGYLLGTNRDERHHRGPAEPPTLRTIGVRRVLAPTDVDAGGTWVALDDLGRCLCLLNGDRPPAAEIPVEPRSRGLLVLDLLDDAAVAVVTERLQSWAQGRGLPYRPFKLLSIERDPALRARLHEWDGRELSSHTLDGAFVVVSSTFETEAVTERRRVAYRELVDSLERDDAARWPAELAGWHRGHRPGRAEGDAFSICMHRDDACSVSHTQVQVGAERLAMTYQPGQPCAGAPVQHHELPAHTPRC